MEIAILVIGAIGIVFWPLYKIATKPTEEKKVEQTQQKDATADKIKKTIKTTDQ